MGWGVEGGGLRTWAGVGVWVQTGEFLHGQRVQGAEVMQPKVGMQCGTRNALHPSPCMHIRSYPHVALRNLLALVTAFRR